MTNLTEQWKKGELPSGWYWVEGSRAEGIYAYTAEYLNNMYRPRNSERIVEQVPSYEEWLNLKEFADYSVNNRAELTRQINFWMDENTKLKELLKECREHLKYVVICPQNKKIVEKLDQVLGEE